MAEAISKPGDEAQPFGRRSVSLGLYAQGLPAEEMVRHLLEQARTADAAGFDGVTVSEHHAAFPGYFPDPVQAASWLLSAVERAWGAACPVLLPLRPPALVVENVAWLAARYPGRVGVGFAPGYIQEDFDAVGASFEDRHRRYWDGLAVATRALKMGQAEEPLSRDLAIAACKARPVPVVIAGAGPYAARWAARASTGLILDPAQPREKLRMVVEEYARRGGRGPIVAIRLAWLGPPPPGALEAFAERYARAPGASDEFLRAAPDAFIVTSGDPGELARKLADAVVDAGASALSVRVNLPHATASQTLDQIERLGSEVLPRIREHLAGRLQQP